MRHSNRVTKDLLWTLALLGLVAAVFRLVFGLGATTNLTDGAPWGLWKVLNMIAGVALATSGFTVGFLVYVLRRERFRPLLKPAILVAFLGYGASCFALLFDIGLPDRFWHPLVMWNHHSFLFEVFWCVMLYFTVTAIELAPTVLERFRAERVVRWLHRAGFGVVVVGISLSSLHHSSLGSLFLVSPQRLHGLWYSPSLPLFFILSAMGCGLMTLVLLRIIHAYWYDPEAVFGRTPDGPGLACAVAGRDSSSVTGRREARDLPMLGGLATVAAWLLGGYLVLKLADLARGDRWSLLTAGTWESWLWVADLVLTAALPVTLVAIRRTRRTPAALVLAGGSAAVGLALNRLNVGIFGYWRSAETAYVPSLAEWALSIGVVAAAGLVFLAAVENLAVFAPPVAAATRRRPVFDVFSRVWSGALASSLHRVTLLAAVALPLGWVLMYPPYRTPGVQPIAPPVGLDATRSVLAIDGDRAGVRVAFAHADHQRRLGVEQSCRVCHHMNLPNDRATPCWRCHRTMVASTRIFDHSHHLRAVAIDKQLPGPCPQNRACAECHAPGRPESAATTVDCLECHRRDMWLGTEPPPADLQLATAPGYLDALHGTCLECHRREEARGVRAGLAECGTCHPTLRPRQAVVALP
ncbi:MAG: cytochrome c3 family protein [Candidatus Krumholzibacteriia bacterium]